MQVKDIDAQTAESFAMPKGIYIYKILKDTGAKNEALQERDIITKLDGQGVYTTANLKALLAKYRAGEEVKLTVMRQDGSGKYNEVEATVTLGKSPAPNGNGDAGNSGDAPSENNTEESQEGALNDGNPEDRNKSGNENNENNGGDNPFKSFQDFFNEYKR